MVQKTFLFKNLFNTHRIIPTRLYNFGIVVLGALKVANDSNQFDAIIEKLAAALAALFKELSQIDSGISSQKIDTRTVDELVADFSKCMSENEGVIAKALGGKASAGYLTFYPNKLSEYSKPAKKKMALLTERVKTAAEKYAAKLVPDLVAELSSFATLFTEKYSAQQSQIVAVNKDRKERGTAFGAAQMALTAAVYTVGAVYPGEPDKCQPFFPFAMLQPPRRRKRYTLRATLKQNEEAVALNYILNKTAEIVCFSKSTNAGYALWLAASPTEPMPADAFVINAGAAPLTLKAARLGNLQAKPFVLVKNLSDVNPCEYELTFVGVKKAITGAEVSVEEESEEALLAS